MKVWKHAIAALLASVYLRLASAGDTGSGPNNPEKIGDGVEAEINMKGFAIVIIALEEPSPSAEASTNCTELFDDIVDDASYIPIFEYPSISFCAGNITSTDGLYYIADTSDVTKIVLDRLDEPSGETGLRARELLASSVPLVGADERHRVGNRGAGVTVAVLDTGIDNDHGDFPPGTITAEACFSTNALCAGMTTMLDGPGSAPEIPAGEAASGHGSHVAGIIASRGNVADEGMAPGANIVALKVCHLGDFLGDGTLVTRCPVANQLAALQFIANNPALNVDFVNMSLGGGAFMNACDNADVGNQARFNAVQELLNDNILTIAAAGNGGVAPGVGSATEIGSPACLSNVVAVGNSNDNDVRALSGDSNGLVDLFAPGSFITAPVDGSLTATFTGTSMASPHVAGCAALLLESGEATTPNDILIRLRKPGAIITVPESGRIFPRLDCSAVPSASPSAIPSASPSAMPSISMAPSSSPSCTPKGSKIRGKGTSKSAKCAGKGKGGR